MLLSVYLLLQVIAILSIIATFHSKTPLASVLAMVTSGTLMVGAWVLEVGSKYIWDPSIRAYIREPILAQTSYLAVINMAVFGLALVFFFYDIFVTMQEEAKQVDSKMKNPNSGGGGQ